jgi:hypothetical protein
MTTEKPKKTPLKTAPTKAKTGLSKPVPEIETETVLETKMASVADVVRVTKSKSVAKASPVKKVVAVAEAAPMERIVSTGKPAKVSAKKAKLVAKDFQEVALPEKSPLKKAPAKKVASKVAPKVASKAVSVPSPEPKEQASATQSEAQRTSDVLKALLANNSDEWFTVEQICAGLGTSSFGVSLLAFSIPEVVPIPVPGISAIVALPTAVVSAQMMAGQKELRLPKWVLRRKVPRKALAAAIHAVLPALKRLEKGAKPRGGRWVSSALTQRLLGLFIFVLALFIALPIPATNMPPAIAIFVTSLGMVERDGLLICVGVLIGLASMVLIGAFAVGSVSLLGGLFNF